LSFVFGFPIYICKAFYKVWSRCKTEHESEVEEWRVRRRDSQMNHRLLLHLSSIPFLYGRWERNFLLFPLEGLVFTKQSLWDTMGP
jgi:hypothetical protein